MEIMADIPIDERQALVGIGVALAIGLLFGVERGWHGQRRDGRTAAGLRTFGLIGLLGGVAGVLTRALDPPIFGWLFLAVALVLATGYAINARDNEDRGITSLIAALLTFTLGTLAALGQLVSATTAAVLAAMLLGFKPQLHRWIGRLEEKELQATLKLLLITVVLLPILPDRGFGPGEALNPYELWWMVVLIASISYLGYFAIRVAGSGRGLIVTSLIAGLASSTALTLQLARLAGRDRGNESLLTTGILIANATLLPRILVILALLEPSLLARTAVPLLLMLFLLAWPAILLWARGIHAADDAGVRIENPLALKMALRFGALLALVMLLGRWLSDTFGDAGLLALAAVSGIADLNAITLSIARLDGTDARMSSIAILIAFAANAVFKSAVCFVAGGARLGLRVGVPLIGASVAGLLVAWSWDGLLPSLPPGVLGEVLTRLQPAWDD
jgi:uncharacterized membrane protein (DUF4010 family)